VAVGASLFSARTYYSAVLWIHSRSVLGSYSNITRNRRDQSDERSVSADSQMIARSGNQTSYLDVFKIKKIIKLYIISNL
jgi:hypothetical protein